MDPALNSRIAWLIRLLTQAVLTSLPSCVVFSKAGREQMDSHMGD
jgi:hypothetical protein